MIKLPLNKVKQKKNESLYSFLHRLALENYYTHFRSMLPEVKEAGYVENCNEIHPELKWVDFIKEFLFNMELDINDLVVNKYDELLVRRIKDSDYRRYNYRNHYHRYSTKFCPDCLNDDFYHRLHWDVSSVTTCIEHKKDLVTKCIHCGESILLSRLMRNQCQCGEKYTAMKAEESDTVSLGVQSVFQELLMGYQDGVLRTDHEWISKDLYFEFFYFFNLLIRGVDAKSCSLSSQFHFDSEIRMTGLGSKEINLNQFKFIVNTIHYLIVNPQEDFISLIDAISEDGNGKNFMSKRKSYKYKYLKEMFELPMGSYYNSLYTDHLNNKTDEYVNNRVALPPMVTETMYLPIHKAMRLVNTDYYTLMNLCNYNLIRLHETVKNGKVVKLIERESILEYKQMKKDHFTLEQAMKYLGLNFNHMKNLLELEIIKAKHGPGVDGYDLWYIPKTEIFRFEEALKGKFLLLPTVKEKEGLSIKQANFKLRSYKIGVGEIYQWILNGRLRVYNDGATRLIDGIKILEDDVRTLVRELYYKRIDEKGYLGKEIQRACKISQPTLNKLLESGILKIDFIVEDGKRTPMKFIKKERIVDYLKKYKKLNDKLIDNHLAEIETSFEPKF